MKSLFEELKNDMRQRYNSNFRIETLDKCTELALFSLCELIEKRIDDKFKILGKELEQYYNQYEDFTNTPSDILESVLNSVITTFSDSE